MYYNIYLFVVIAFKSMVIHNTVNMLHPLKLKWIIFLIDIMYYKSHILPYFLCYFTESNQRPLISIVIIIIIF